MQFTQSLSKKLTVNDIDDFVKIICQMSFVILQCTNLEKGRCKIYAFVTSDFSWRTDERTDERTDVHADTFRAQSMMA